MKQFKEKFYSLITSEDIELPDNLRLGSERSNIIMINVILPLAILYARNMSFDDFEEAALQVYQKYSGLPGNFITRDLMRYMTESQRKLISKKAVYQQGLLDLYYNYCIHHSCKGCKRMKGEMVGEM